MWRILGCCFDRLRFKPHLEMAWPLVQTTLSWFCSYNPFPNHQRNSIIHRVTKNLILSHHMLSKTMKIAQFSKLNLPKQFTNAKHEKDIKLEFIYQFDRLIWNLREKCYGNNKYFATFQFHFRLFQCFAAAKLKTCRRTSTRWPRLPIDRCWRQDAIKV